MELKTVNLKRCPQPLLSEGQFMKVSPVVSQVPVTLVVPIADFTDINRVFVGIGREPLSAGMYIIPVDLTLKVQQN